MVKDSIFLIGINDSKAAFRSVAYVADMVGSRDDCRIILLHVLPPIPPELLEFGGAEDPGTEHRLNEALKQEQSQWVEKAQKAAEPILEHAQAILYRSGIPPHHITTRISQSIHRPDIVRELIESAKEYGCGSIVVGRETYSSFQEMFHRHVGEELARHAVGFAIWVIA